MSLHLTKVAVGCRTLAELEAAQRRWCGEGRAFSDTRMMPKRADELPGGSLYWIIAHRLVARQPILGLAMTETPWGRKCRIELGVALVPVMSVPRRAHQGWRYMEAVDAPADLPAGVADGMPDGMLRELQAAFLI
jgi:hypothetical protein